MISYITRVNFGAIVSEMVTSLQISKSRVSMALTGSFITYGAGQIISGICGDKYSPKRLISYGLIITVLMNILLPICANEWQMLVVWSVNGFAQAFIWPPMVKIMSSTLSESDYNKAAVRATWGGNFGAITVYLLSPVIISFFGWKGVFFFSALLGAIMVLVWNRHCFDTPVEIESFESEEKQHYKVLFTPFMLCVMLAIVLQGILRDGVTTWMPSYVSETYNISNVISIFSGILLPIFGVICVQIAERVYSKKLNNPLQCGAVFFTLGALSALALFLLTGKNATLSVLFSALLTGCMHGVNVILICMIPPLFKKYGNVSTVSGVLNSCTYVGSALSTYGIAFLSEKIGWQYTLLIWLLIAITGALVCGFAMIFASQFSSRSA